MNLASIYKIGFGLKKKKEKDVCAVVQMNKRTSIFFFKIYKWDC